MESSTNQPWHHWIFVDHLWMVEVIGALLLLLFLNIALKRLLGRSKRMKPLKESDWRRHLEYAAVIPARVLLWLLLATFLLDIAVRELSLSGLYYVGALRNAGIIACLAWFLLRWKNVFHHLVLIRSEREEERQLSLDPFTWEIIGRLFTIMVLFFAGLIILQLFGLNIIPLVTFGGIGAAILGIAGKDAISNFFGGLMIYLSRPFMVNDLIELPQRKLLGFIEEIGWYFTSVRDLEKKPLYIPNSVFSTELVINLSRITHRRIEELIAIRYDDLKVLPKIIEEIRALFEHNASIDPHQPIHVFLKNLGEFSVQIEIRAYVVSTKYEDFMEVRQTVLMEICKIIEKNGALIPYPTTQVLLKS